MSLRWPSRRPSRDVRRGGAERDEGVALVFALVFILLATIAIVPILSYSRTVMRAAGDEDRKITRISATTGAMRIALADPGALYHA